jgi:hypothetical protein
MLTVKKNHANDLKQGKKTKKCLKIKKLNKNFKIGVIKKIEVKYLDFMFQQEISRIQYNNCSKI